MILTSRMTINKVSVKIIDACINDLKRGKVCESDDLVAEHLLSVHPSLVIHLIHL